MSQKTKFAYALLATVLVLLSSLFTVPTISPAQAKNNSPLILPDFEQFKLSVHDGQAGVVRGVYVPEVLAAKVLQQPANRPDYVSPVNGIVTEFANAKSYGNIGLLAHNYLAGANFSNINPGDEIWIVYGDGKVEIFIVKEILRYQALESNSPTSNFIDLNTRERETAASLFKKVYKGQRHVTLQTCIYADRNMSWGRLFVIAVPITEMGYKDLPTYY
jgi:hypothetical protein